MKKATVLKSLWFGFAASIIMMAQPTLAQDNIIVDGDFSSGTLTEAWEPFQGEGATADFNVVNGEAVVSNASGAGGATWHLQLNQGLSAEQIGMLNAGETYRLTFDARSDVDGRPFRIYFGEDGGSWTSFAAIDTVANAAMQTYEFEFTIGQTFDNMKLGFELGLSNGGFVLDNVALQQLVENEIIVDGDFTGDALPETWTSFQGEGATADFGVTNNEATVTNASGAGGATWHLQLVQNLTPDQIEILTAGEPYTISFDARSNVDGRPFKVYFGEDGGSWTSFTAVDTVANSEMQTYTFSGTLGQTFASMKFGFELGLSNDDFIVDNVSLTQLGTGGSDVFAGVSLPVSFDEDVDYALTDFGNNVSEIVEDPT
ncbi:MAG: carbohydrate binding domain-containing protein, partial [Gracilimonas sp.]